MTKVIVTGGSGKAGSACIKDLLASGYEVVNVDRAAPQQRLSEFISVDLTDYGQTIDALSATDRGSNGAQAIVHLSAIPAARQFSNAYTYRNNTLSDYNVFEAARRQTLLSIEKARRILGYEPQYSWRGQL